MALVRGISMNISKDIIQALNNQISLEAASSQHYLATAGWCELSGYDGAATYFYAQSDEERMHMLKIIKFLHNLGISAKIAPVATPSIHYKSLEDAIKDALKSEQVVTAAIHKALTTAHKKADYSTFELLEWFASEQVQEETKFEAILQKFDTIGRDGLAVAEIDRILASQAVTE